MRTLLLITLTLLSINCSFRREDDVVAVERAVERRVRAAEQVTVRGAAANPAPAADPQQTHWPAEQWARIYPPSAGWSEEKLEEARRFYERTSTDAVVIVHRGAIVAAWGDTATPFNIRSVRKALLSSLLAPEFSSGRLKTTQTLAELGIDDVEGLTPQETEATVHDVLSSSSGIFHRAAYEPSDPPARGSIPRGTFVYNNWDFNLAGALYEKSSRRSIGEAFAQTIAGPLQMRDFDASNFSYRREKSSRYPAYLFEMSARDLARYGLLFARHGNWRGKQLVDAAWIDASTTPYVKTPREGQSFGYLWWVMNEESKNPGAFVTTGNGGQQLFVDPKRDLVVVQLASTKLLLAQKAIGIAVSSKERAKLLALILAAAPDRTM